MALAAEPTMVPLLASRLRGSGSWPMFVSLGLGAGSTVVPLLAWKHLLNHNAGRALCFFSGKQTVEFDALYPMFIPTCGRSRSWIIRLEHGTLSDRKATYPGKNEGV
ncbi:hypothetical protein Pcac1_g24028 [Phytophthora cactorum]|nr:hypothetical protein Pcac1_g24028 [Phytophthora cactorum]KAG2797480.1 hypothetical protein PC111_g21274 [Phytophthora cactorum]KAG2876265.1 hypothetical protein PC114_g24278 [Phytophthora cactorum]KAG2969912.1 hypothetical protein PC119_g23783 [Phytophthora cactorum]KAG3046597.1 hypothetical protein PC121_g20576 [Phytophthora cactorum]